MLRMLLTASTKTTTSEISNMYFANLKSIAYVLITITMIVNEAYGRSALEEFSQFRCPLSQFDPRR